MKMGCHFDLAVTNGFVRKILKCGLGKGCQDWAKWQDIPNQCGKAISEGIKLLLVYILSELSKNIKKNDFLIPNHACATF